VMSVAEISETVGVDVAQPVKRSAAEKNTTLNFFMV